MDFSVAPGPSFEGPASPQKFPTFQPNVSMLERERAPLYVQVVVDEATEIALKTHVAATSSEEDDEEIAMCM